VSLFAFVGLDRERAIRRVTGEGKERFFRCRGLPGRSLKLREWLVANLQKPEIRFPFPTSSVIFDKIGQCHFCSKNKILLPTATH
jgi:hypothetical protein